MWQQSVAWCGHSCGMQLLLGFGGKCSAGGDLEGINFQKVREDKNPEGIRFTS